MQDYHIMLKVEKEITIRGSQGLHARPAALFVQIASKYNSKIIVRKGKERVNGKSIMGILMLAAQQNSKVILEVSGDDATEAAKELETFLTTHE